MQRDGPGGVPAQRAGWWENVSAHVSAGDSIANCRGGAAPVPVTFFAPPKKVTRPREGTVPLRLGMKDEG